ncbi:MAG: CoA transferase [Candidatus Lokiarchaeota archaeon]|nr:CoA transferase [Candidatus Lokiarchaeota archaeon]MBD3202078.1 CoA transferase [Candidatus Lokiarchaeota archaeon]
MTLPLEGIRVLDLSRMLPGPYCSMILADLGAEIIRVENPKFPYANPPPFYQKGRYRVSAFNAIIMRDKKSITLNLKKTKAREIFYELVKNTDVVLETFRPKVTNKLGIDYKTLSEINQGIIYCSLSGYGQTGPYEQWAGHDLNYVGICGILNLNRERKKLGADQQEKKPIVPGLQAADLGGGLMATIGILSAIIERRNNPQNQGQYIDIGMLDTVFSFMPMAAAYHFSKDKSGAIVPDNPLHGSAPYYSTYKTKDNKFLTVGAIEMKFWHQLCEGLGREDLKLKQGVQGEEKEHLFEELQNEFIKKTQHEWMEIFNDKDACVAPIKTFGEACEDPQIKAREMVISMDHPKIGEIKNIASPIKMSRTPLKVETLAPKVGQQTKEVLSTLGYTKEDIKNFKKKGII